MTTLFTVDDPSLGKTFSLHINRSSIIEDLKHYIASATDDESGDSEYPLGDNWCGHEITQEMRDEDNKKMLELIALFEAEEGELVDKRLELFVQLIEKQPKKKNGSFAKSRVNTVVLFSSFGHYWEDSYGTNTPALRIRTKDDYEAILSIEEYVVRD